MEFYNKLKVIGYKGKIDSENSETKLPTWLEWIESKGITQIKNRKKII